MRAHYSEAFKTKIIQRGLLPGGPTGDALAAETGVAPSTVYRWLREARESRSFLDVTTKKERPPVDRPPRRAEDWSKKERLRVVVETSVIKEDELGAFLRREGLHEETLTAWRAEVLAGLAAPEPAPTSSVRDRKRIAQLERELVRKDKQIEATEALLDLAKKVQALWGDAGADTTEENEK